MFCVMGMCDDLSALEHLDLAVFSDFRGRGLHLSFMGEDFHKSFSLADLSRDWIISSH